MQNTDEQPRQNALREMEEEQRIADVRAVMSTVEGRRFIWSILSRGQVFAECFTGNSKTFYLLGRREFVLGIYNDVLRADQTLYWQMQAENIPPEDRGVELQKFLDLITYMQQEQM